ncbi:hypothetical protein ROHU_001173 [Labeo rohita]|uniref:Uncharacterized protein n=1 Tax=Labeo rohita TaxID=84645 RepID=A0A498P189_LABRO|nr:hypothetical protein ROHU_001173 [Labeo rohita]
MEVQSDNSLQKPIISFNGDDVQPIISCEIPHSVRADFNCSLYTEDGDLRYQGDSQWSSTSNTTEQTTTTAMKTYTWFIVLVFIGVAVILAGLMGLICLCYFTRKKGRNINKTKPIKSDVTNQGTGMSCSEPAETYSLITSVPATSQPISGGLKHPESHQDNKTDPTDTRSVITSINPIYQPSEFPTVHVSLDVIRESNSVLISRSVFGLEIRVHL